MTGPRKKRVAKTADCRCNADTKTLCEAHRSSLRWTCVFAGACGCEAVCDPVRDEMWAEIHGATP